MELLKMRDDCYINTASVIFIEVDSNKHTSVDYFNAILSNGNRIVMGAAPKGMFTIETFVKQHLIIINKDNNEQSAHTTPTLR